MQALIEQLHPEEHPRMGIRAIELLRGEVTQRQHSRKLSSFDEVAFQQNRTCDIQLQMYIQGVKMQVSKWGNSLAIRLPASVVDVLELHEGDDVEVIVAGARTFALKRKPSADEMLERLKRFRGRLPVDFKFDRDDANGRN